MVPLTCADHAGVCPLPPLSLHRHELKAMVTLHAEPQGDGSEALTTDEVQARGGVFFGGGGHKVCWLDWAGVGRRGLSEGQLAPSQPPALLR